MATTNTWDDVVAKIAGVVNRGAFSKTFTPVTTAQSVSGGAGYYSSVYTACNAVSLTGNASAPDVLTGKTFYSSSLTKLTGTMINVQNNSSTTLTTADPRKILEAREQWVVSNSDGTRRICLECPTTGYYTNNTIIATKGAAYQLLYNCVKRCALLSNTSTNWTGGQSIETNRYTVPEAGLYIVALAAVISFNSRIDESAGDTYNNHTNPRILLNGADVAIEYKFSHPGQITSGGASMAFSAPFTSPKGYQIFGAVQGNLLQNAPQHLVAIVYDIGH